MKSVNSRHFFGQSYFSILHKKMQVLFCKFTEKILKFQSDRLFAVKLLAFFHKFVRCDTPFVRFDSSVIAGNAIFRLTACRRRDLFFCTASGLTIGYNVPSWTDPLKYPVFS